MSSHIFQGHFKNQLLKKKTIERLSRNLNDFNDNKQVMGNYINIVKQNIKDDFSVIIIDNSDIAKPCSKKLEALTDVRDGSTGEIVKGYQTIEAAVLTSNGKMPLPVYEKVFSAAEKGFISETHENIQCLKSLSEHFGNKCIRTLDRGFDANEYFRYFIKNKERFIIRLKMNRNVIYNGKTQNVLDVANKYKGNYKLKFKGKNKKDIDCKISYIPVSLCEFPKKGLTLIVVYGFGKTPMMLLTNLNSRFIYYAIGYAIESILVKTKVGIKSFIPKNIRSQQYDIFKYFKLAVS